MKVRNLDYSSRRIIPLFPSLMYRDDKTKGFDDVKEDLIKYAYKQREEDDINQIISNRGGWQTPHLKMTFFNTESFKPYMNWFSERLKEYLDHMDFNMSCGRDIFLSSMWFNINGKGAYNISHQHVETTISGVLWIKIPKNSGGITFVSPYDFLSFLEMHSYTEEFQKDTNYYHNYTFPAREGSILLFPSHIQHKVEENKSKEDRISVSFNLKLLNDNY